MSFSLLELGSSSFAEPKGGLTGEFLNTLKVWGFISITHKDDVFFFLGGGQLKYFILFSHPKIGEEFQFDSYFSDGLKPPTSFVSNQLPFKSFFFMQC